MRRLPLHALLALLIFAAALLEGCRTTPDASPVGPELPVEGTSLAVDDRFPPAADVERLIASYRGEVEAEMLVAVATAPVAITRGRPEGTLGNLIADSIRTAAERNTGQPVDLAFSNAGGVRNDIPAGKVTVGTLFEVMPFDNSIVVFELSGEDLQRTLDSLAARGGDPMSGARYLLKDGRAQDLTIGGRPINPKGRYRVATNDYVFDGGGRIAGLDRATRVVRTGVLLRDALIDQVRELSRGDGTLQLSVDGRIRVAGEER
ncbi:MAG: 5'-nucleotidase C-terminal domain-containing protein [Pseudomonadota bacterium]